MQDFYSFDELSIPLWIKTLFWEFYTVVFVYAVWKTQVLSAKYKRHVEVSNLLLVYFIAYAVFYCVNPDYFRYRAWLTIDDFSFWTKEDIYVPIVQYCQGLHFEYQYEVFRLIVWGTAVLLIYQIFILYRKLLLPGLAFLFFFILAANTFSYARASLGMAVYFFGMAIYWRQNHNKLIKCLGIFIALLSYFFHHEMIIAIAAMPCLTIPVEKNNISFLSIIWLAIVVVAIMFVSTNVKALDSLFDNDYISSKIEGYNVRGQGSFRLSTFINYFKYYYPFSLITKRFWKQEMPRPIVGMYRITYAIILMTVAFIIVFGLRSTYTYRVMYISMIPLSLLTGYCYYKGYLRRKQVLIIFLLNLLSSSTRFINA